jgi:hypothetical protein
MTDASADEKVAHLLARGGLASYGLYWRVLETIGRQIENGSEKCAVSYPISTWAAALQVPPQNVCRRLAVVVAAGLLQMSRIGATVTLSAPNMLKYRDEWQRKLRSRSGVAPEQDSEADTDTEADGRTS